VDAEGLGKSRAQCITALLNEMNPLVAGHALVQSPLELIDSNLDAFKAFNVVIAGGLSEAYLLRLASFLYQNKIILVVARAYGLIGYLRCVVAEHTVLELKQEAAPEDQLRLADPFAELIEFADLQNFADMKNKEHKHTPFVVILLQAIKKWKTEHGGNNPHGKEETAQFKVSVRGMARKYGKEENFQEAVAEYFRAYTPVVIPSVVRDIINDEKAINLTDKTADFWFLVHALRQFVHNEGGDRLLPLMGTIPDMTSDTDRYIALQHIYNEKANRDVAAVTAHLENALRSVGRDAASIPAKTIKTFCKNAQNLFILRFKSLEQEYNKDGINKEVIADELNSGPENDFVYYILLRAADRFHSKHGRYPAVADSEVATDFPLLKEATVELMAEWGIDIPIKEEPIQEMCRFGAAEIHNIAAFIGGVGSQEIIKLVTHQYQPMNNTFVYNGMNCTASTVGL